MKVVVASIAFVGLIVGGIFAFDAYSKEDSCACGTTSWNIWSLINPLRPREPERMVGSYVAALARNRCQQLPSSMFLMNPGTNPCGFHHGNPNFSHLMAIEGSKDVWTYEYNVGWDGSSDRTAFFDVTSRKDGDVWKIVTVDTFY